MQLRAGFHKVQNYYKLVLVECNMKIALVVGIVRVMNVLLLPEVFAFIVVGIEVELTKLSASVLARGNCSHMGECFP